MKLCKTIFISSAMIIMLLLLCSCRRSSSGLRSNLKTVDISKFSKTISSPNTDARVNADDNGQSVDPSGSNGSSGSQGNSNGSSAQGTVSSTTPKENNAGADGKTGTSSGNNGSGTGSSGNTGNSNGNNTGTGDVDLPEQSPKPGKKNDKATESESHIRQDGDEMKYEKYLIYLPGIVEVPTQIDRTDYGVTIHFMPTTQERFDRYVSQLKNYGFVQDMKQSTMSFTAHTRGGMNVKFTVDANESWLAIYDDARHLG